MLSGMERGDHDRVLRLADLHLRYYTNIGPEPADEAQDAGAIAVSWVQDEGKGNDASSRQRIVIGFFSFLALPMCMMTFAPAKQINNPSATPPKLNRKGQRS